MSRVPTMKAMMMMTTAMQPLTTSNLRRTRGMPTTMRGSK